MFQQLLHVNDLMSNAFGSFFAPNGDHINIVKSVADNIHTILAGFATPAQSASPIH